MIYKEKKIDFFEWKKDDYILVKVGCFLRDNFIAHRKCKNIILSILARVIIDYDLGLIYLRSLYIWFFWIKRIFFNTR